MTTINFSKTTMPTSKTFNSYDEIIRYFQTEAKKLDIRKKALGPKCPETRSILENDKKSYDRIAKFFNYLNNKKTTVRNELTGEIIQIERR